MRELVVHRVGGPCLVQDAGRPGHAVVGVGASGAADRASYDLGNRLVGNAAGAAGLEVVLGGLEVEATATTWLCVTGAPVPLDDTGARLKPDYFGWVVSGKLSVRNGVAGRPALL